MRTIPKKTATGSDHSKPSRLCRLWTILKETAAGTLSIANRMVGVWAIPKDTATGTLSDRNRMVGKWTMPKDTAAGLNMRGGRIRRPALASRIAAEMWHRGKIRHRRSYQGAQLGERF